MLGIALFACGGAPPAPEPVVAPAPPRSPDAAMAVIDLEDPASCAPCHAGVVEEWRTSMHARAHHAADPVYGAMRDLRMKVQGEAVGAACHACHAPRAPGEPESAVARRGVTCVTCHAAAEVHLERGQGATALVFDDAVLRGARDLAPGASPVHGTCTAAPHLADGRTICLACHDATETPTGAAACTTGPEYVESGSGRSCSDCHLPRVAGPSGSVSARDHHASHAFLGPHAAWSGDPSFLATALDVAVSMDGREARVTVANQTGHAFPTGFPGRVAALVVRGLDASGAEVWSPPEEGTVFRKMYVDAEGKPVPSPFSVRLAEDTRLRPGETRQYAWGTPAEVASVRAEVVFRLVSPPLAEKLGLAGAPEAEPRVVERVPE